MFCKNEISIKIAITERRKFNTPFYLPTDFDYCTKINGLKSSLVLNYIHFTLPSRLKYFVTQFFAFPPIVEKSKDNIFKDL